RTAPWFSVLEPLLVPDPDRLLVHRRTASYGSRMSPFDDPPVSDLRMCSERRLCPGSQRISGAARHHGSLPSDPVCRTKTESAGRAFASAKRTPASAGRRRQSDPRSAVFLFEKNRLLPEKALAFKRTAGVY